MAFDAVISSGYHSNDSIRSIPFEETIHIGGGESRLEMLPEWVVVRSAVVLCRVVQSALNALGICPSKVGLQSFDVWHATFHMLWASYHSIAHAFNTCNRYTLIHTQGMRREFVGVQILFVVENVKVLINGNVLDKLFGFILCCVHT